MKRAIRAARLGALAATALVAAVGCGFPSVEFDSAPFDASEKDAASDVEAGRSPDGGADARVTGDGGHEAGASDATIAEAAGDSPGETDGSAATDATASGDVGSGDATLDSGANDAGPPPDSTASDGSPLADGGPVDATSADAGGPDAADGGVDAGVNCNCGAGAMVPTHVTCTGLLSLGILTCNAASGFTDDGPPCGQASSTFITCPTGIQLACTGVTSTAVQRCLP